MRPLRDLFLLSLLTLLAATVSGAENTPRPPDTRLKPDTRTPPAAAPTTRPPEPAAAPAPLNAFEAALQNITRAEREADFTEALRLCRGMKESFKTPEQQEVLNKLLQRLNTEKKESIPLAAALRSFLSGQAQYMDAAEEKFLDAPETASLMLRQALRTEADDKALLVAKRQIGLRDTNAIPALVEQLGMRKSPDLLEYLGYGLRIMHEHLTPEQIAACFQTFQTRTDSGRRDAASVLECILRLRYQGNTALFNTAVQDSGAATALRDFVEKCLLSSNLIEQQWACEFGSSFAGLMKGARGQYYTDATFGALALTALDALIRLENDKFPFPEKRQQNVSARWTGVLDITTEGEYTFVGSATPRGTLVIAGQTVLTCSEGKMMQGKIQLPAGRHPLVVEYAQTTAPRPDIELKWSGPGIPLQPLSSQILRSSPVPEFLAPLHPAIRNLTATNWPDVRTARATLANAYQTGGIFLRETLMNQTDPLAAAAARQLLELGDSRTPPILLQRIEQAPHAPTLDALTATLCDFARSFDASLLQRLQKATQPDTRDTNTIPPHKAALCSYLLYACTNEITAFNTQLQDPAAGLQLQNSIQRALISSNEESVIRAAAYGAPFAPLLSGLRGRYFAGNQFDELRMEQVTPSLNFSQGIPSYPPKWEGEVSAQWTGLLPVETAGEYLFSGQSDGLTVLWIDDNPVVSVSTWTEKKGRMTLNRGLHRLRIHFQGNTGQRVQLSYSGPNTPAQVLSASVLRTPPWLDFMTEASRAVSLLSSTNPSERRASRAMLLDAGDCGRIFLRNALRYKSDIPARDSACLLAGMNDAETAGLLVTRILRNPAAPSVPALFDALWALAPHIPVELLKPLPLTLAEDTACRMTPEACILGIVLDRTCGRDAAKFNQILQNPKAYEQFHDYVRRACSSRDEDVLVRAACFGTPVIPALPGLLGRYYSGLSCDTLLAERNDPTVAFTHTFSPPNRTEETSARWSGTLHITQPGTYTFWQTAHPYGDLRIDDKLILVSQNRQLSTNAIPLSSGMHRILATAQNNGGIPEISLAWTGPTLPKITTIPSSVLCTPVWPAEASSIAQAVPRLAITNMLERRAARNRLLAAGEYANLFLLNALRYQPDNIAREVAQILVDRNCDEAAPLLLTRARNAPESPIVPALLECLREQVTAIPATNLPALLAALTTESKPQMSVEAAILCFVLERRCAGQAAMFNPLLNNPQAHAVLSDYMEKVLNTTDEGVQFRAACYGAPFIPSVPGWAARYYAGQAFDDVAMERMETAAVLSGRVSGLPNNRTNDISVRWHGLLPIDKAGTYTFFLTANPLGELRIDGKPVAVNQDGRGQTLTIPLAAGLHRIQASLQQQSGGYGISLAWKSTEMPAPVPLAAGSVQAPIWPSAVRNFYPAITNLTSTNLATLVDAKATLLAGGEAARFLLRCTLRDHSSDEIATRAATILAEQNDPDSADLILKRLLALANKAYARDLVSSLRLVATKVTARHIPALMAALPKDGKTGLSPEAWALCTIFGHTCRQDKAAFGAMAGNPKAADLLRTCVEAALESTDRNSLTTACEFGGPFVPGLNGWLAHYYEGAQGVRLTGQRRDNAINQKLPNLPNTRQNDFAVRWSGFLSITQSATYSFHLTATDGATFVLDGQDLVSSSGGTEQTRTNKLTAGMHPVQLNWWQSRGSPRVALAWTPPGAARQPLGAPAITASASREELAQLAALIDSLAVIGAPQLPVVTNAIAAYGVCGTVFLRQALQAGTNTNVVVRSAACLAGQQDPRAADLACQRLRNEPKFPMIRELIQSVQPVIKNLSDEQLAGLTTFVARDEARAYPWHAGLLSLAWKKGCAASAEQLNTRTRNPQAFSILKSYSDAMIRLGTQAPPMWTNQFRVVQP